MSLGDIVRDAVALADKIGREESLEANITHEAWTGHATSAAKPTYAAGVTIPALVDESSQAFRSAAGETLTVKAVIYIHRPIAANGSDDREEPLDPRDRITLPRGTVGTPIQGAGGFVDPSTGKPYMYTVGLA